MNNLFKHVASVQSVTSASTAWGSPDPNHRTRISFLPCLVQATTESAVDLYGKKTYTQVATLFCEYNDENTKIHESDRILFNGITYQIMGIDNAGGQGRHLEITLEKLELVDE